MSEKKRQEKTRALPELEGKMTEILVANGRALEPFVKTFTYSGENVATQPLGTLVGVFEIADRSEDSAYIVNFLSSVAKKEYFNNPRRGAIESFEAALHKINLALAELVKHGNVSWLGKLHGGIGVIEKNNLHFSVTGETKILLLRNGTFSEISLGLASDESSVHPIKTFIEVSSGRLMPDDKIILASPELFSLFSLENLEKQALRMDNERFTQFLRTALVNELDMTGVSIIDFHEKKIVEPPKKQDSSAVTTEINAFSNATFSSPKMPVAPETTPAVETPAVEYIDSKTGHIYIQGDTPNTSAGHPVVERTHLILQDIGHSLITALASQKKLFRKGKKQSTLLFGVLSEHGRVIARKGARLLRRQWQRSVSLIRSKARSFRTARHGKDVAKMPYTPTLSPSTGIPPTEHAISDIAPTKPFSSSPLPASSVTITKESDDDIPPFLREKLASFYRKNTLSDQEITAPEHSIGNTDTARDAFLFSVRKILSVYFSVFRRLWQSIFSEMHRLFRNIISMLGGIPPKQKLIVGVLLLCGIFIGTLFFLRQPKETVTTPVAETIAPSEAVIFPLENEKNARLLGPATRVATPDEPIIASVLLANESYVITGTSIVSPSENKTYAMPETGGPIRFVTAMDDLRLIFIYTENRKLFAWSPISHTFVENTLSLPGGSSVTGIGTYLTYLYVLDDANDQIYRFPRADGGFGQPSLWLKDTVSIETNGLLAVNETIFISPDSASVQAFFRGRFTKQLESPNTRLSVNSLYSRPGLSFVYALDTANKRILVWNQDGTLVTQHFSEELTGVRSLSVDEKTGEAFVAGDHTLLSFRIGDDR